METLLTVLEQSNETTFSKLCFMLEQYGHDWVADELHSDLQWEMGKMELDEYVLQEANYFANTLLGEHGFLDVRRQADLTHVIASRHQVAKEAWKRQTIRRSQKSGLEFKALQQDLISMLTEIDTYLSIREWNIGKIPQDQPPALTSTAAGPNYNATVRMLQGRIMMLRQVLENINGEHNRLVEERNRCYEIIGSEPEDGPLDDTLHAALNKVSMELGESKTQVSSKYKHISSLDGQVRNLRKELSSQVSQKVTQLEYLQRSIRQTEKSLKDVRQDLLDMTKKRDIFKAQVDYWKQRCEILEKTRRLGYYYLSKVSEPRALKANTPSSPSKRYLYYDPELLEVEGNVVSMRAEPSNAASSTTASIMENRLKLQGSGNQPKDISRNHLASFSSVGHHESSLIASQQKNTTIMSQTNILPQPSGPSRPTSHSYMRSTVASENRSPRTNDSVTTKHKPTGFQSRSGAIAASRDTSYSSRKPAKSQEGAINIHEYSMLPNTHSSTAKSAGPVGIRQPPSDAMHLSVQRNRPATVFPTSRGVVMATVQNAQQETTGDHYQSTAITVDSYIDQLDGGDNPPRIYHYKARKNGAGPPSLASGQYRPISKSSTSLGLSAGSTTSSRTSSASEMKHVTFSNHTNGTPTSHATSGTSSKEKFESILSRSGSAKSVRAGTEEVTSNDKVRELNRKDTLAVSGRSSVSSGYSSRSHSTMVQETRERSAAGTIYEADRNATESSQSRERDDVNERSAAGVKQNGDESRGEVVPHCRCCPRCCKEAPTTHTYNGYINP